MAGEIGSRSGGNTQKAGIDLLSLYVLFSHFRLRDATRGNSFLQMSSYARANVRITNDKNKRQIPMRASRGLKWENKMYKLKRSIGERYSFDTIRYDTIQLYLTTLATHNKSWFPGGASNTAKPPKLKITPFKERLPTG